MTRIEASQAEPSEQRFRSIAWPRSTSAKAIQETAVLRHAKPTGLIMSPLFYRLVRRRVKAPVLPLGRYGCTVLRVNDQRVSRTFRISCSHSVLASSAMAITDLGSKTRSGPRPRTGWVKRIVA
jgi:hypothetical protein